MKVKKYIVPVQLLQLEDGYHLLVRISINGKMARVLIDTGASHTVFDKKSINKFMNEKKLINHNKLSTGLGTSNMTSQLALIEKIAIGKLIVKQFKTVIIDLSHVNSAYKEMKQRPIAGVLGSDILKRYSAIIDFGKRILVLSEKL